VIDLGDTSATIQCASIELKGSRKEISDTIKELDLAYGPVTHLYEVAGISNHIKESQPWNLVRIYSLYSVLLDDAYTKTRRTSLLT